MSIFELEFTHKDYHVKSKQIDKGNSLVTILKDDNVIKEIKWPTYKIFNIPAHIEDIVYNIEEGLRIAGSTGLGGNVYSGGEE